MLWTIFVILLVLWLLGFSLHIAGSLIHILLVVALIILVINLVSGRRSAIPSVESSTPSQSNLFRKKCAASIAAAYSAAVH
jgi:beta-lactam-binding protein with PASTA domain